jgi:hypothetical protein
MSAHWLCAKRLTEILRSAPELSGAKVLAYPPGDKDRDNEYVFVSDIEGGFVDGPSAPGRLILDDEFTINLVVQTKRATAELAMDRLAELCQAVAFKIRDSGNLDAYSTGDFTVSEARPGTYTFSSRFDPEVGQWALATLGVDVEVRHYGGNP